MKNLSFIAIAIFSAANAYADNNLDSIFFIPQSNEIITETSYSYSDASYIDDVTDKQELRTKTFKERVSLGITDKLYANLEISYIDSRQKDIDDSTGQFTNTVDNGVSNPELSLGYRFADNANNGFFSDIIISYLPNVINSKTGDSDKGGNVVDGGSEYEVAGSYGLLFEKISFKIDASARYFGNQKTEYVSDNTSERRDSSIDTELGITGQYKFNKNLSLNASLFQLLRGSYKIDKVSKIQGRDEINLGTRLNYSIIPDKALISVAYNYVTVEDEYNTDSTGTVTTSSDRNRDEIEISFRYKF